MTIAATQPASPRSASRPGAGSPRSRAWALAGVIAGVCGVGSIVASTSIDAVYNEKVAGDAEAIMERLSDQVPQLMVFGALAVLAATLLVPFAAGLRRRLHDQAPAGSILPDVAFAGLLLTSVAGLMGSGLNTEFSIGLASGDATYVPEVVVMFGHWIGTIPWLWLGAGITGVAVAVAALRTAAAPRWIGWVSVVLGGLTLVSGLSPLQYIAGFVGPVYVLVMALGFALGDRAAA